MPNFIDPCAIKEFLKNNLSSDVYLEVQNIWQNIDKIMAEFDCLNKLPLIVQSQWDILKHTPSTQEYIDFKQVASVIFLKNKDPLFPIRLRLTLLSNRGRPVIECCAFNVITDNCVYGTEFVLKKITKKQSRAALCHYWETGGIAEKLNKLSQTALISFEDALKMYPNKKLSDGDGRFLTKYKSDCIKFIYAQVMNSSINLLSMYPQEWQIPRRYLSKITQDFEAEIQICLQEFENIHIDELAAATAKTHYPDIETFCAAFF